MADKWLHRPARTGFEEHWVAVAGEDMIALLYRDKFGTWQLSAKTVTGQPATLQMGGSIKTLAAAQAEAEQTLYELGWKLAAGCR
jgi:hypothetical protein